MVHMYFLYLIFASYTINVTRLEYVVKSKGKLFSFYFAHPLRATKKTEP